LDTGSFYVLSVAEPSVKFSPIEFAIFNVKIASFWDDHNNIYLAICRATDSKALKKSFMFQALQSPQVWLQQYLAG
jgi:hypothetical protein